jgi:hypothetical protein
VRQNHIKIGKIRAEGEYISPGITVPVNKLDASHPAAVYLRNRGFNLDVLGGIYRVSWCEESKFKRVRSTIVIPVIENGAEIAWSSRPPHEGPFLDEQGNKVPKYYHMPGFRSQKYLLNFDVAKHYKTVILVEGQFDAMKVGGPAVALFGKSLSRYNLERLVSLGMRNDTLFVVALDPDKPPNDRQAKHHIEVVVDKFKRENYKKVMPFYLPTGTDPAGLAVEQFKTLLYSAAEQQNIQLDFSKTS